MKKPSIEELFPHLSESQQKEVEVFLKNYAATIVRMYFRRLDKDDN